MLSPMWKKIKEISAGYWLGAYFCVIVVAIVALAIRAGISHDRNVEGTTLYYVILSEANRAKAQNEINRYIEQGYEMVDFDASWGEYNAVMFNPKLMKIRDDAQNSGN